MSISMIVSVSVVIPCFNAEKTIKRALESVKGQTAQVTEIICVDDSSTDLTTKIIEDFKLENLQLSIILVENSTNEGPSNARNSAWDLSKGDYIAFLDADDAWNENKIFIQYSWMKANPDVVMSGHDHVICTNSSPELVINETNTLDIQNISPFSILVRNHFATPTVMLKRELFYRFKSGKRYCEDHLLWAEIILDGNRVAKIRIPLTILFKELLGASGLSENIWNMELGELEMYHVLAENKYIDSVKLYCLLLFSLIKYLRRWFNINILNSFISNIRGLIK
jgi:teichuronic acid biosynthesis glycosyltransferase TuaG